MATLKRVAEDAPRPIREIIPEVPEWLCDIVAKLHAKKPDDRFQSAKDVADLLRKCLAELQQGQMISGGQAAGLLEKLKAAEEPETKSAITGHTSSLHRHNRRWAVGAAVLLLALGGFSLTEATGVTNLRATVIRIFTAEGTLVVETDDPAVKLMIEGDGDLVISGAGPQEVRLKSGSYKLRATKNGKAVQLDRDLVTITRGDRQVVRVRLEGDAQGGGEVRRFEGHEGPVRSVAFSPDGRYALSGSGFPDGDKTMRLWDVTSGREVRRFEGHEGSILFVALSPNGERALSSSFDKTMRLWDVKTGQPLRVFRGHDEPVTKIVFTPDGRRALSGSNDKTVRLWDLETGEELRRFKGHARWVQAVSLAPDGRHFLSASWDGTVRLWDLETGEELRRYSDSANALFDVAFLPNGNRFLSGGDDGVLRLWDLDAGKVLLRFEGHKLQVFGLAVSRDGSRALSASGDGTVRLWDVSTGRQLHCFRHHEIVTTVAFSPDGRYALSAGGFVFRDGKWLNGTDWAVHLWRLPDPPDP
jgi:WD40 repeat protein